MRQTSRLDYETRINRVMHYVEEHVGDDLSLATLARRASLSPFHFHRVFRAMTGEAVSAYVQRKRLEKAARELHDDKRARVLDVALRYGYESSAAFTKAFRRLFGVSPAEWRKGAAEAWVARALTDKARTRTKDSKIGKELTTAVWQKLTGGGRVVRAAERRSYVEDLPSVTLAGMRYVGRYGSDDITRLWDRVMTRAHEQGLVDAEATTCVGIVHDDPAITDPRRCRYDACVVVTDEPSRTAARRAELAISPLRGGPHLAFPFLGKPLDVDPAWDAVYAELPESGHAPANRPRLEWYDPGAIVDAEQMIFRCKLCVPLRRMG